MTLRAQSQFRIKTSKNGNFKHNFRYVPVNRIQYAIAQNDQYVMEKRIILKNKFENFVSVAL